MEADVHPFVQPQTPSITSHGRRMPGIETYRHTCLALDPESVEEDAE